MTKSLPSPLAESGEDVELSRARSGGQQGEMVGPLAGRRRFSSDSVEKIGPGLELADVNLVILVLPKTSTNLES